MDRATTPGLFFETRAAVAEDGASLVEPDPPVAKLSTDQPSVLGVLGQTHAGGGRACQFTAAPRNPASGEGERPGVVASSSSVDGMSRRQARLTEAGITVASDRVELGEDLKTFVGQLQCRESRARGPSTCLRYAERHRPKKGTNETGLCL